MTAGKEHGGKREGAGRKPLPDDQKRVQITAIVSPHTLAALTKMKAKGEGWGTVIDRIIRDYGDEYQGESQDAVS